jgi:ribosomal-protein-serine acetyltransferase
VTPPPHPSFDLPGGRLLRPLDDADAPELYALIEANRAHLARWMRWAADQTAAQTLEFIRTTGHQLADDEGFQAVLTAGGRLVGVAGLRAIDWPNRATSIGYWLAAAEQGRGTMTGAMLAADWGR